MQIANLPRWALQQSPHPSSLPSALLSLLNIGSQSHSGFDLVEPDPSSDRSSDRILGSGGESGSEERGGSGGRAEVAAAADRDEESRLGVADPTSEGEEESDGAEDEDGAESVEEGEESPPMHPIRMPTQAETVAAADKAEKVIAEEEEQAQARARANANAKND